MRLFPGPNLEGAEENDGALHRDLRNGEAMSEFHTFGVAVVLAGVLFFLYTYFGYPLTLWLLGLFRAGPSDVEDEPPEWPTVSISVPAYNEEEQIEGLIRSLLALEYPRERIQILIVSDASKDRTDEIVRSFAPEGVELLRMPVRGGKTRAENAAAEHLRGEIIVNTDASIRIAPGALKPLVAAFRDPTVGLASGRDVSVGPGESHGNVGESGYVGYEMAVRDLETRVAGIVGASGCFYAILPSLHGTPLPAGLSRDFAAALITTERGYRSVSVPDALCFVPRTDSLRHEYQRKVRTIARGMDTLVFKSSLLNPFRYGMFSWMLFSHKVCRWALPWVVSATFLALGVLSFMAFWALSLFLVGLLFLVLAVAGWWLSDRVSVPRVFSVPAFLVLGHLAAMVGLVHFFKGDPTGTWEPTRRKSMERPPGPG